MSNNWSFRRTNSELPTCQAKTQPSFTSYLPALRPGQLRNAPDFVKLSKLLYHEELPSKEELRPEESQTLPGSGGTVFTP